MQQIPRIDACKGEVSAHSSMKNIVCQKCGDIGYKETLVYCAKCRISAEHRYCLDIVLKDLCEDITWECQECACASTVYTPQVVVWPRVQPVRKNKTIIRSCKTKPVRDVFIGNKSLKYHLLQSTFPSKSIARIVSDSDNLAQQPAHNYETLHSSCDNEEVKIGIGVSISANGHAVDGLGLQPDDARSKWNASKGLFRSEQHETQGHANECMVNLEKEAPKKGCKVNTWPSSHISLSIPDGSKSVSSDVLSTKDGRNAPASSKNDTISDSNQERFILGMEECVVKEEFSVDWNHANNALLHIGEIMDNRVQETTEKGDNGTSPPCSQISSSLPESSKSGEFFDIPCAIDGDTAHTSVRVDTDVESTQDVFMRGKDKYVDKGGLSIDLNHVNKSLVDLFNVKSGSKCGREVGVANNLGLDLSCGCISSAFQINLKIIGDAKHVRESHHSHVIREKKSGISISNVIYPAESGNLLTNNIMRDTASFNKDSDHLNTESNACFGSLNSGADDRQGSRSVLDDINEHCNGNFYVKSHDVVAIRDSARQSRLSSMPFSKNDGSGQSAVSADESIASDKGSFGGILFMPTGQIESETGQAKSCGSQDNLLCPVNDLQRPVGPFVDAIWRGGFVICNKMYHPIMGHLSSLACEKACNAARSLPLVLHLEKRSRLEVQPDRSPRTEVNIDLFLFPGKNKVCKKYSDILKDIANHDLALRVTLDDAELLIFSSIVLPKRYQVFNGKNYLWGLFRPNKDIMSSPSVCSSFKREVVGSPKETNWMEVCSKTALVGSSSLPQMRDHRYGTVPDIDNPSPTTVKAQSMNDELDGSAQMKLESPLPQKKHIPSPRKMKLHAAEEAGGVMEIAKSFCTDMNSDGLWDLIITSKSSAPFHSHLPRLIMNCADPPHLVLDAISRVLVSVAKADIDTNHEASCLLLLNSLRSAMNCHTEVSVMPSTKERAREVADSWKEIVLRRWPDKKVKPYALTFLVHVFTFGILDKAEKPLYQDLVASLASRKSMPKIAMWLGLDQHFARGLIRELIRRHLYISALNFVKEFCLLKEFPPAFFFKSYLEESKRGDERKQIDALKAVMDKISQFKLDHPDFTESNLRSRILLLEQQVHGKNSDPRLPSTSRTSGLSGSDDSFKKQMDLSSADLQPKRNTSSRSPQQLCDGSGECKRPAVASLNNDGEKRLKMAADGDLKNTAGHSSQQMRDGAGKCKRRAVVSLNGDSKKRLKVAVDGNLNQLQPEASGMTGAGIRAR